MEFDIEQMRPEDGFHSQVVDGELVFDLTYKGEKVFSEVFSDEGCFKDAGDFATSQLDRVQLLLQSFADFLNAGGSLSELKDFSRAVMQAILSRGICDKPESPVLDYGKYVNVDTLKSDHVMHTFLNVETNREVAWERFYFIDLDAQIFEDGENHVRLAPGTFDVHPDNSCEAGQTDSGPDLLLGE